MARKQRGKPTEVNLVSARSELNTEFSQYSRTARSGGYAKQRARRARAHKILLGTTMTFLALLLALGAGIAGWYFWMQDQLHDKIDLVALEGATVDRAAPEDPFWMLLVGTDYDDGGVARSDSIILARIDPGKKNAVLVSIPRDTRVQLPGYGYQKINAAYAYGQMERDQGHSGPEFAINAVSELTGVGIAGFAQVDINGFQDVVEALGGVQVDVPLDIIGDREAGDVDVYAGPQVLDGAHALVFVRSRQYAIGDYQRQANQRTFLQATAKQILSSDPLTIVNTVNKICEMTATNFSVADIAGIASAMRGMQESDIRTYSIPSATQTIDEVSYVIADTAATRELFAALERGEFPDPAAWSNPAYQGEVADAYKPRTAPATTDSLGQAASIDTSQYTVVVRNGYGIDGSATSVSDMLALAGYIQGEIGNANAYVYEQTLIVYRDDTDRAAADDIRARLGYGRIIASQGRYSFEGNVLVVVGGDFKA